MANQAYGIYYTKHHSEGRLLRKDGKMAVYATVLEAEGAMVEGRFNTDRSKFPNFHVVALSEDAQQGARILDSFTDLFDAQRQGSDTAVSNAKDRLADAFVDCFGAFDNLTALRVIQEAAKEAESLDF